MNIHLLILIELAAEASSSLERVDIHLHVASNATDLAALRDAPPKPSRQRYKA